MLLIVLDMFGHCSKIATCCLHESKGMQLLHAVSHTSQIWFMSSYAQLTKVGTMHFQTRADKCVFSLFSNHQLPISYDGLATKADFSLATLPR